MKDFNLKISEIKNAERFAAVDARNVAVQRLIDETGHGLDVYEVTDVCEIKD